MGYYILAITLSWAYWFALLARGMRVEPGSLASHLPGLLGPAIAAVVVISINEGSRGLKALFVRTIRLGSPAWSNVLLSLSPIAIGIVSFTGLYLLGNPLPGLHSFALYPGIPGTGSLILVILVSFFVNGFGEEIGWRGFATEKLLERHGWFRTTLFVAGLWAIWHIPVFWLNTNMTALIGPAIFGWLYGLLCGAFVLAHVYLLSGHSILAVAIWHTAYNMMVATEAGKGLPAAVISTIVMIWGTMIAIRWWRHPPKLMR